MEHVTECDEVAAAIPLRYCCNFDDALRVVRGYLPDESETIISNTAAAYWGAVKAYWPTAETSQEKLKLV